MKQSVSKNRPNDTIKQCYLTYFFIASSMIVFFVL